MRNASRLRALRTLMDTQELLTANARQTAAESLARETKLRAALADQEKTLETSLRDWASYLASGIPDTQQLQRLGTFIARQDLQRAELAGEVDTAASTTDASRLAVATADAHTRLTGDALKAVRKSAARDRDEAAAEALEHRMAYDRSRA